MQDDICEYDEICEYLWFSFLHNCAVSSQQAHTEVLKRLPRQLAGLHPVLERAAADLWGDFRRPVERLGRAAKP